MRKFIVDNTQKDVSNQVIISCFHLYLSDEDIQSISFNYNFSCKCQKTLPSNINELKYVLKYICRQDDNDDTEKNIIDYNDQQLDNLSLQSDFKY